MVGELIAAVRSGKEGRVAGELKRFSTDVSKEGLTTLFQILEGQLPGEETDRLRSKRYKNAQLKRRIITGIVAEHYLRETPTNREGERDAFRHLIATVMLNSEGAADGRVSVPVNEFISRNIYEKINGLIKDMRQGKPTAPTSGIVNHLANGTTWLREFELPGTRRG
ncbi:TPA: hypothetical protein HA244_00750 [Candidatus Micrarchaeota archaeon]|nr:hypothetical protein [Candidatus Micrarchaeota archaeon]